MSNASNRGAAIRHPRRANMSAAIGPWQPMRLRSLPQIFVQVALIGCLALPLVAERQFEIDGPMELHIWMTAKPGQADALRKTFTEVFYPAVSSMPGFRDALLMRKPGTEDFTVRLSFESEEQRMEWVASDKHQRAWPALAAHAAKTDYDGFAVIHPR